MEEGKSYSNQTALVDIACAARPPLPSVKQIAVLRRAHNFLKPVFRRYFFRIKS